MRRVPWLVVATIVVAAGTVWLLFAVWRSPHRTDLATYWALVAVVLSILGSLIAWALRQWQNPEQDAHSVAELNHLADLLARSVKDQWTQEAGEQGLLEPDPIPVRWKASTLSLGGPISAAASSTRFPPLPGVPIVGPKRLQKGNISDLHQVYGGLGSGRLVIAGNPGSGKTGAAILLILAILAHREKVRDLDRDHIPVPVMFTLHDWDPRTQRMQNWLALKLQQTYKQFTGRNGAAKATELLTAGKIAVILEGLDEIPPKLRPIVLQALSRQAAFRVVVLTRSAEMAATATYSFFEGAATIELQNVVPAVAADYLTRIQCDPAPRGWRDLTELIRQAPNSPVTQALNSPLTLTLVRDTYRSGEDVSELLNLFGGADRDISREDIVDHLLDRVLPAAYTPKPGYAPPRYSLRTARITLQHIAVRMNQDGTRDLQWWRIREWVADTPRRIATGLICGLITASLTVPWATLASSLWGEILSWTVACGVGLLVTEYSIPYRDDLPKRRGQMHWRQILRPEPILSGLAIGFIVGWGSSAYGWWIWMPFAWRGEALSTRAGTSNVIIAGMIAALTFIFILGLRRSIFRPDVEITNPLTPLTSWRSDRAYNLVVGLVNGLVCGLTIGLIMVLGNGFAGNFAAGLFAGAMIGLGCVFVGGLVGIGLSSAWAASLAFTHLALRWQSPVQLMQFLEDARQRHVLRTVGPAYQFRHGRLQDRLGAAGTICDADTLKRHQQTNDTVDLSN